MENKVVQCVQESLIGELKRFSLLGVKVQLLTIEDLNRVVFCAIRENTKVVLANHNLHSVYLYHNDLKMKEFYDQIAHFIHIDGMPLIWLGKLLGYPFMRRYRTGYMDWIYPLMSLADQHKWRIFYLGSQPGVAHKGIEKLTYQYPHIKFEAHHGFFDLEGEENELVLAKINAFEPNILFVGMGMPRQEKWISANFERINANVVLNAGACIDYIAGVKVFVPRWIGYLGLEWFVRLLTEPRRLWKRYLYEPLFLSKFVIEDIKRKYWKKK